MDTPHEKKEIDILIGRPDTSIHKKIIERKLQRDADEYENTWRSCLGCDSDKRVISFFTQITIIVGVMVFAMIQLIRLNSCSDQNVYLALLSTLIGVLVPNPRHGK